MARTNEAEAVRTTIVGGRPPGSGRNNVPVPRGIEVLVKKAAVDAEFREMLLAQRGRAAASIELELDPDETTMLSLIPQEQLARVVDQTEVRTELRPVFLGRAAAVMLAALGAGLAPVANPAGAQPQSSAPAASQTQPAGVATAPLAQFYEVAADAAGPGSPAPPAPRPLVLGGGCGGGSALIPPPRATPPTSTDSSVTNQIQPRPPIVGGGSGGLGARVPPARSGTNSVGQPAIEQAALLRGGIGLGTWDTKAEFKDILVQTTDGKTLLKPDFAKGLEGWQRGDGQWEGADGVLSQNSRAINSRSFTGENTWTNYTYSLKARRTEGTEGFLIIFAEGDDKNLYWWNIGGWGNTRSAIEKMTRGAKKEIPGTAVDLRIETGTWHDIKIAISGRTADCYFDGKLITSISQDQGHSTLPDAGPPKVFNNGMGPEPAGSTRRGQ